MEASRRGALLGDRAGAGRPGFALTGGNAGGGAEICRRLGGLPLASELAAARTRLLDPPALLDRLAAPLDAPGTGAVDPPARQRTPRATGQGSLGPLPAAQRAPLEVTAGFADGRTGPAPPPPAGGRRGRAP